MDLPWPLYIVIWLMAVNLATWIAFATDKHASVRAKRRIPERTLLLWAAVGGSLAALAARQILRHKTRKEPFRTILFAIVGAQVLLVLAGVLWLASWIG